MIVYTMSIIGADANDDAALSQTLEPKWFALASLGKVDAALAKTWSTPLILPPLRFLLNFDI